MSPAEFIYACVYFESQSGGVNALHPPNAFYAMHVGSVIRENFDSKNNFRALKFLWTESFAVRPRVAGAKRLSFALAGHLKSSDKEKILIYERWLRSEN